MSTVVFAKEMHVRKMNKNHSNANFESETNNCFQNCLDSHRRYATIQIGSTPPPPFFSFLAQ